jgi:hypothetical protein
MKIKSTFEDPSGQRVTEDVLPATEEGQRVLEDVWLKGLYELFTDALQRGDDIEIIIKRSPATPKYAV